MGQALAVRPDAAALMDALASDYVAAVQASTNVAEVRGVRIRADIARTALNKWFKTHERAAEAHRNLLRIDAEALARICELGGADELNPSERAAAKFYASMTDEEREAFVDRWAEKSSAITAYRAQRAEDCAEAAYERGLEEGRVAANGLLPSKYDSDPFSGPYVGPRQPVDYARSISQALEDELSERTSAGVPFSVEELAESVLCASGTSDGTVHDRAVRDGLRRVFGEAVRRHALTLLDGTRIPRFITARVGGDHYVRVPVENASMGHLRDAIEIREEQVRNDEAALETLRSFHDRLTRLPGGRDGEARIGDLIAAAMADEPGEENAS